MARIHKYKVGDHSFYTVSDSAIAPGSIINISKKHWQGSSSSANVPNVIRYLEDISFSKEEEPKEELENKKKALSEQLDIIASELQADGRPELALVLDRVSDSLEK